MEAVEDIPGAALHEGIQWEWETFPEYLDALDKRSYACDVAVMIGHGGVRTWVMGNRANVSDMPGGPEKNPVTDDEIEAMASVVREAVAAGALGFSTSRLLLHRDNRGILTPGALAAKKEMLRICDAVAEGGGGVFEMSADFASYDDIPYQKMNTTKQQAFFNSELEWMAESMDKHRERLKVTFGTAPQMVQFFGNWAQQVSKVPGQCVVQFQTRPQSFHMAHTSGRNMFMYSKTYNEVRERANGDAANLLALLTDTNIRRAVMEEMSRFKSTGKTSFLFEMYKDDEGTSIPEWMVTGNNMYPWEASYEPTQESSIPAIAARAGTSPLEVVYDLMLDVNGSHGGVIWRPLFGYSGDNEDVVSAFECENVIPGFDDAGAHNTILTDATCATTNICYYGRNRTRGRCLPLEKLVKMQTSDAAAVFNLGDRGVLRPGMRADVNVIDLERLGVSAPYWANDLPTNAGRWLQYAEGYRATILRGVVTFRDDQHTGELPGRLVRNSLALGTAGMDKVTAANATVDAQKDDLTDYAVEVSRNGGASAFARVLREEEKHKTHSRL